jgi:hypothetical protein
MNNVYEAGEWPKDFSEVTIMALKRMLKATKCSDHHTLSIIAHTTKIVAKILRRMIEMKVEDVLGEVQFGFRSGIAASAVGMLRIISE